MYVHYVRVLCEGEGRKKGEEGEEGMRDGRKDGEEERTVKKEGSKDGEEGRNGRWRKEGRKEEGKVKKGVYYVCVYHIDYI